MEIVQPGLSEPVLVKAAVILGSCDLQGKAYLLNMTQHNGMNGCLTCEEQGFVAKQGKGHSRCYPYKDKNEAPPRRTTETFLQAAFSAHASKKRVSAIIFVLGYDSYYTSS